MKKTKSILFVAFCTLFVLGGIIVFAHSKEHQKAKLKYEPGTYFVSSKGYHDTITLAVTFDESCITDIKVVRESETKEIGSVAIPKVLHQILDGQGGNVDGVTGATVTTNAIRRALCEAAELAKVSDLAAFKQNDADKKCGEDIDDEWDIVIVGGGGAGLAAAAQAVQEGNTVLVMEKNAELGGNTVISGGGYQSVTPYLVWEMNNPDATEGIGYDGKMYAKVKAVKGNVATLETILGWSEKPFDEDYYASHQFEAGNIEELSKHGVHKEYLPTLRALKNEIRKYLAWVKQRMDKGMKEDQLTLFSTNNLHIFQTYYGGLRMSNDGKKWCYGDAELVSQFINESQKLRPWLANMGVEFYEKQGMIVGSLWYRCNSMKGAEVTIDGKTKFYERNKGTYVMAPYAVVVNGDKHNKVMTQTTAKSLIMKKGRVVGVNAECEDGCMVTAHARKGVIIATGGFAANIKMVIETNCYWKDGDLQPGTKTTNRSSLTGDGIIMAQGVGADVVGMGWTQLMPLAYAKTGELGFGMKENSVLISPNSGKRYVDELSERDVLSIAAFRNGVQMEGVNGVHFFISKFSPWKGMSASGFPDIDGMRYTLKVSEFPDLFKRLGLKTDANAVANTIRDFDKSIIKGKPFADVPHRYIKTTIGSCDRKADGSYDMETYNLEDSEVVLGIFAPSTHHTMGGLRIDASRRVLDRNGNPIPGLFAAGEVTGGIHGGNRLGGNALTEVLVSGRIAAHTASE